jgi:hypothetical protein
MTFIPPGTPPTNPDTLAQQYIDHFNSAEVHEVSSVYTANFPGVALDTERWVETTLNGGTVSVADGVGSLDSGTDAAGEAKIKTVDMGAFQAGRVSVFQTGTLAGIALVDRTCRWGMESPDGQDGIYFEMLGTAFGIVTRKGGVETRVEQASFSGNKSFTPDNTNATYYIHFSAGQANFEVQIANETKLLHRATDPDFPLVNNLNLNGFFEVLNTGNTTSSPMKVRGVSQSIDGNPNTVRPGNIERDVDDNILLQPVMSVSAGRDPENIYRPELITGFDSGNSTATELLGADEVFTGEWINVEGYSAISLSAQSDQISAVNGIFLQFADDALGTNIRTARRETYTADNQGGLAYYTWHGNLGRFMRLVWTNGSTPQTAFFLYTVHNKGATEIPQSPVTSSLGGGNPAIVTRSVIAGRLDDGSNLYDNVNIHQEQGFQSLAVGQGHRISQMFGRSHQEVSNGFTELTANNLMFTVPANQVYHITSISVALANTDNANPGKIILADSLVASAGTTFFSAFVNEVTGGNQTSSVITASYPEPAMVSDGVYFNEIQGIVSANVNIIGYLEDV